ncbi:hypothetical protein [Echinicola sp. 20G]|uniref:hypothetical protein n=1 Tax=Echinicola sp. 20G TaxID=2781961 RepID=UPI0019109F68|nr:hypothetical protein [Echinicola sp. 20G]
MIIGNKETIAFELFDYSDGLLNMKFHLGNKLISDEPVYVPTYNTSLQKILEQLNAETIKNDRLRGLTPIELVKTLESERDSNESQFFKHLLQIDETIDQYSIYFIIKEEQTQFCWYCWDEDNCNSEHEPNMVYFVTIRTSELISTLKQIVSKLRKEAQ